MRCSVQNCANDTKKTTQSHGITFHMFPKDPNLRIAWIAALGMEEWEPKERSTICSEHFSYNDFYQTKGGLRKIKEGAVPVVAQIKIRDIKSINGTHNHLKSCLAHKIYDCNNCDVHINDSDTVIKSEMTEMYTSELDIKDNFNHIAVTDGQIDENLPLIDVAIKDESNEIYFDENVDDFHESDDDKKLSEIYPKKIKKKTLLVKKKVKTVVKNSEDDYPSTTMDKYEKYDVKSRPKNQDHKLTSGLSVSRTEHMSTVMPLCSTVIKEEPSEEIVGVCNQQEPTSGASYYIKLEPMSDNPGSDPNSEGDAIKSNSTGVPERSLTAHQETCAEKDAGTTYIKKEPVRDHRDSLWEADPEEDDLQSYDVKFVVRRETTNVATYSRKRKAAPLELKPKLRQPENAIKIEPLEMLQQTENAGTSAREEETCFNASKTKIEIKTSSELDLERDKYIHNDCNRVFNSKTTLRKHVSRYILLKVTNNTKNKLTGNLENSKWHTCHICGYASKNTCTLRRHIRTHTGEKPNACHMCNFKCNNKSNLISHMRTHTGEKPYACPKCEYKATQASHIKVHLRTHTGERSYAGQLCDYKRTQVSNTHLRRHRGERSYAGQLCDDKSTQVSNTHLKTHRSERPYACHLCNYKYKYINSLQVHLRKHTGEKPYACHLCDFKCTSSGYLQIHLQKHSGEKPYACYICDYKSTEHHDLRTHLRTHAGDKQYACRICDYKGAKMGYLRSHILKTHTDEQPYAGHFKSVYI